MGLVSDHTAAAARQTGRDALLLFLMKLLLKPYRSKPAEADQVSGFYSKGGKLFSIRLSRSISHDLFQALGLDTDLDVDYRGNSKNLESGNLLVRLQFLYWNTVFLQVCSVLVSL